MTLRLLVAHTPAEREAARRVEAHVFLQAFGNTPQVMEQEYGPYAGRSRFITVIDESTGSALGAARLITPDASGMVKTLADVAGAPWHLSAPATIQAAGLTGRPVWDVASLAVDRRYRSGAAGAEVTLALCHGLYHYSQACGAEGLVTVLDDRVLRLLRAMGVPWTPMAGASSQDYLGSPASTPCVCLIDSVAGSMWDRRPDLAPAVVEGRFRSIARDPADLAPGRGVPAAVTPTRAAAHQPLPARRDTTGWRPPTDRRPGVPAGRPSAQG